MNAKEMKVLAKWNKRNTTDKAFSDAAFRDLCDLGAEIDPNGTRHCCIEEAFKQVFEHGTEADIDAAIRKLAHHWYLLGKYDSMTDLLAKLAS